jgi:hypothetical protein
MRATTPATTDPPGGLSEQSPEWHYDQLALFTQYKHEIGEPSPHLAMVGHMGRDTSVGQRVWMLGCYAAVYCLPTAQILWTQWPWERVLREREALPGWIAEHWKGMVTRRERRCVRSAIKLSRCLMGYAEWAQQGYPQLPRRAAYGGTAEYYEQVWDSVLSIPFIGRYIGIRLIEGLRRYAGVPASLLDIRSIGGWSPKKALVYLYPDQAAGLLTDSKEGNALTDQLAEHLLARMRESLPWVDHYILAAMLCEYREAFEDHHQYPGWTIDQEPLLYDKVKAYWGERLDESIFWDTRRALFPAEVLGETTGAWRGTRWELTKTLRDHGYTWSDLRYDFATTLGSGTWATPARRAA